jgi:hypothetical protein
MPVIWKCFLVLLFLLPLQARAEVSMYSRNLHCDEFELVRTRTICHALEREMKWEWFGHAIISPGWRPTFKGAAHVFCALSVDVTDIPAIIPMTGWSRGEKKLPDWRLESGSQWLIFLLGKRAAEYLPSAEARKELELNISSPASIWNPSNSEYPLRNGCR